MTTGLDPAARRITWELIRSIRDRGATVVLVTHFMDEAEKLCDRLAVIDRGKIVAMDSPHLPQEAGLLIPAFLLGLVSFTAFGFFLGAVLPSTRSAQSLGLILFFVMMILGGAGPPPEVLTGAMDIIGRITPLRHVIIILQDPYLGFGWNQNSSLIVAGITVVAAVLSARFFRWE